LRAPVEQRLGLPAGGGWADVRQRLLPPRPSAARRHPARAPRKNRNRHRALITGEHMGVRLMVEILDHWSDAGLTSGERSDLLVIAENANDATRETFGSIHAPYILRRAGKSPAAWKNAIGKLMKKKALEY